MCNDNATLKTIVGYQIVTLQSIAAAIQHQSTITTLILQHSVGVFFPYRPIFCRLVLKKALTPPQKFFSPLYITPKNWYPLQSRIKFCEYFLTFFFILISPISFKIHLFPVDAKFSSQCICMRFSVIFHKVCNLTLKGYGLFCRLNPPFSPLQI